MNYSIFVHNEQLKSRKLRKNIQINDAYVEKLKMCKFG